MDNGTLSTGMGVWAQEPPLDFAFRGAGTREGQDQALLSLLGNQEIGKMRSSPLFSIPGAFLGSGINFLRFWGHKPAFCVYRSKTRVDVNKIHKQNINVQSTVLWFVCAVYV